MKKIGLFILLLSIGTPLIAQKIIPFHKMGGMMGAPKDNGYIEITDSTLRIHSEPQSGIYKGTINDYELQIVGKDEKAVNPTYNCVGQVGSSDRHTLFFDFKNGKVIWTSINSFSNDRIEQFITLVKK